MNGKVTGVEAGIVPLDVLRGYPAKALVSEFYQGLETDDQDFVSAIHSVVGPSFEYPDYSSRTVGGVVRAAEKNIESIALYAATHASVDLMAEGGVVALVQSGVDCDGVPYLGRRTLIKATVEAYLDYCFRAHQNSDGVYKISIERPSQFQEDSSLGKKAYHFSSLSIVGMRDLNGGVVDDGTQYEADYHNPEIYSVYAHFQESAGQPSGSLCVGDRATHQLAMEYAAELADKYGYSIEDLSKSGWLAKETAERSVVLAQTIARAHGSFVFLGSNIDQCQVGRVIGVTDGHVVLSLGRSASIVAQSGLSRVPALGENVMVTFKGGKGIVSDAVGKAAGVER